MTVDVLFTIPPGFEGKPVSFVSWKKREMDWNPISIQGCESEMDKAIKLLLIKMVQYNPEERPSMREVEKELQRIQETFVDIPSAKPAACASLRT